MKQVPSPRRTRLIVLLTVLGFCLVVGLVFSRARSQVRVYQGKTVKAWLLELNYAADPRDRAEAEAAFAALGTNALPELTRLAGAEDAWWRRSIWVHTGWLPRRMRAQVLTRVGPTNACVFRPLAAQALAKLGPDAAPAIPALVDMLKQGDSMYEQTTAAQSLAEIGAPALAALIDVAVQEEGTAGYAAASALLRHYHWPGPGRPAGENLWAGATVAARQQAVERLGASDRADEVVIKVLARAARDPAPGVRLAALKALAQANQNLHAALPQLIGCAYDESPVIREWSARVLGKISPPTGPVIDTLTWLTEDEDESVRRAAQSAWGAIQASVPTNAPAPPR